MKSSRITFTYLVYFVILLSIGCPVLAQQANSQILGETYILALSACPPWKKPQFYEILVKYGISDIKNADASCQNSTELMVNALKKRYSIPDKNVITLVNSQATISNINKAVLDLKKKIKNNDQLIFYSLLHASDVVIDNENHEMVFLWSKHYPSINSYLKETALITTELYSLIENNLLGNKIFILDACHSNLAQKDHKFHPDSIVITSAKSKQFANFTEDYRYALFTKEFSDKILKTDLNTPLFNIFYDAKVATEKSIY